MNPLAISKAEKRLVTAFSYLDQAGDATHFAQFEEAWTRLLNAGNSIAGVLEKGAKDNAQSRQWYGGKKKAIKSDELLRYMHQARNADEHGIEDVTRIELAAVHFRSKTPSGMVHVERMHVYEGVMVEHRVFDESLEPVGPIFTGPQAALKPVIDDRFGGETFAVPMVHLGKGLTDRSPYKIAELWLDYMEALIAEAKTHIP